ncbi:hypothetical protein KAR91_67015 [Candidatus Pacearchaeota archaeon]|nr:hypothetical protein [Candidatus Pacearchaeota archaeon]
MSNERVLGPNMRKLLARVVAREAIQPGGGIADGIKFITSGEMGKVSRESLDWIDKQIQDILSAPDNIYGNDEETIAGSILTMLEKGRQGE